MAFGIEDFRDLVRVLEEHPEWRADLRRLVLTEELLGLPAVLRELAEAQRRAEGRLSRVEEQLGRLVDAVADLVDVQRRTEERLGSLDEAQLQMRDMLGRLGGRELERLYRGRVPTSATTCGESDRSPQQRWQI
jgi:septation ring formation regulator EzrA